MIKLTGIYKIYENGTVAVRNASLGFPRSGMVAIVGSSGCGKSTLLNLLSNNDTPSKGELYYEDKLYSEYNQDILIKDFAYIYQDFKLIENLTVYQNIKIGHELANKDIDNELILNIADRLGITEILDKKVYSLSGGQQQRVAIARAMARRPKVIFADEPTGNLDSKNTEKVYEILKEISSEILVLIVSHDMVISNYADRIIEMHNGKVINDCTKEEYSQKEEKNNQGKEQFQEEILNIEIDCNIKKENAKIDKKQSKIGSKSIFSYKKGKNITRKKQGLSLNSIGGLTIAFNNKGIVKKIILSLICAVMIGLILASTSMIFSSYEYTFYNLMKNSEDKLVSLDVDGGNDNIGEEVAQFISNECGIKVYKAYNKFRVSDVYDLKRIDESPLPPCYEYAFVNGIGQLEIFLDKPEELGIKMLYGRAPVERNEIAISKTNLDYWLHCKDFVSESTGETYHFESANDIIGKKNFNGSSLTIVGAFDDRNKFNNMEWTYEEIDKYARNNLLYNTVIRPESIAEESKFFDHNLGNSEGYHFTADKNSNDFKDYASFMPLNQPIFDYYNDNKLNNYTLNKDEIVIADSNFIDKMNERGRPLKVGDKIELSYVKTNSKSPWTIEIEDEYFTKTYKIVGIEKDSNARCIFINEQEYLSIYKPFSAYSSFLFSGENLSLSNLKKISSKYRVFLMLNNLYNIRWDETEYIIVANNYIAIPMFILAVFILVVLLSVIVSDIVKIKGREVLILKSCGAKQIDILKVFSVNILAILFAQMIVGIIFGFGILSLFNYIFNYVIIGEVAFDLFWIGAENIFLSIAGIIFVSIIAIYYSMRKLNGKNLRKSFQKQKI